MSRTSLSVLQVDTSDVGGGAERVMTDLHDEYRRRGIDAWMAVGFKRSKNGRVLQIPNDAERSGWERRLAFASARVAAREGRLSLALARALLFASDPMRYRGVLAGVEDFDFPATAGILGLPPGTPDVLHLHNLHGGYFDIRSLPALTRRVPAVLTMHDAWLLTGHCAHPFDCEHWRGGCGECPSLGTYVPVRRDGSAATWQIKHDAVRASRIAIATPSQWLMRMVTASDIVGDDAETRVIPNGVDTAVFSPGDQSEARAALRLRHDCYVVLFTAQLMADNPFKDYATLLAALPLIRARDGRSVQLVVLGFEASSDSLPKDGVVRVPYVKDREEVARYYRAADVYVHSARIENLPLAIIEAMACGTSVVASRAGGIPELAVDGETGTLVPVGDANALAAAVNALLDDEAQRRRFAEAGLARVRELFTLERQADAYIAWYEELTDPAYRARAANNPSA